MFRVGANGLFILMGKNKKQLVEKRGRIGWAYWFVRCFWSRGMLRTLRENSHEFYKRRRDARSRY